MLEEMLMLEETTAITSSKMDDYSKPWADLSPATSNSRCSHPTYILQQEEILKLIQSFPLYVLIKLR